MGPRTGSGLEVHIARRAVRRAGTREADVYARYTAGGAVECDVIREQRNIEAVLIDLLRAGTATRPKSARGTTKKNSTSPGAGPL